MRIRLAVVLSAGLATSAAAQELVSYELSWSESLAGSSTPVAVPNGIVEPGEGIRIALKVTISPPIGSTATYTPPPPPGVGTIAGLESATFQILATNANGGTWSNIVRNAAANPGGIPGGGNWTIGSQGTPLPDGSIEFCQAGQFPLPGMIAQSNNPIANLWRGTWTPANYSARTVQFVSSTAGLHQGQRILIQYGIDANGDPQYVGKKVPQSQGPPVSIPVIPAPASLMVMAIALAIPLRLRQRR